MSRIVPIFRFAKNGTLPCLIFVCAWIVPNALAQIPCFQDPRIETVVGRKPVDLKDAVGRGIERVSAGVNNYPKHRDCFSCHHQAVPLFAISKISQEPALELLHLGEQALRRQRILEFSRESLEQQLAGLPTQQELDGRGLTLGYALWTMVLGQSDWGQLADQLVSKALATQQFDGRWRIHSSRPPAASSEIMATAFVVYGLNHYTQLRSESERVASDSVIAKAIYQALLWRSKLPTPTATEDLCGMLLIDYLTRDFVRRSLRFSKNGGLPVPGGSPPEFSELSDRTFDGAELEMLRRLYIESHGSKIRDSLLGMQNTDGGWGFELGSQSDAYSTATVLLFLLQGGSYSSFGSDFDEPWFQAAVRYLVETQELDGSWHVSSRATPVQEYFDNGDPHESDQFISMQATAWSVAALEAVRRRDRFPLSSIIPR